jgi:hypothetical protein
VSFQGPYTAGQTQPPMPPIPPGERPASRDDMTEVLSVLGEIRLILEEIRTLIQDTRKG